MTLPPTINEISVQDFRAVRADLEAVNADLHHPALERAITFLTAAAITWGEAELVLDLTAEIASRP
jgi:hypothetical protein